MIEDERRDCIRDVAARLLLVQDKLSPVIDVRDMKLPKNIYIVSFGEYSRITGISISELTVNESVMMAIL